MKNKFTFILGGIRSGKSSYALELAKKSKKRVVFIATAFAGDPEMKKRIALHKRSRPKTWATIEESKNIKAVLAGLDKKYELALVDCLGVYVSNLLSEKLTEAQIKNRVKELALAVRKAAIEVIVVSNEVGLGLVALNPLARNFQDLLGFTNQEMAKCADEVIFMRAGIAQKLKGDSNG